MRFKENSDVYGSRARLACCEPSKLMRMTRLLGDQHARLSTPSPGTDAFWRAEAPLESIRARHPSHVPVEEPAYEV